MASKTTIIHRHVTGIGELSAVLQAIPREMRSKILAAAVGEAAKPVVIAAKRFAKRSERTGTLRDSIGHVVRNYEYNGRAVAIIGPINGHVVVRINGRSEKISPVKYAHLVEFGHHAVKPIKGTQRRKGTAHDVKWVKAKPFMRPAVATTAAEVSRKLTEGIGRGIEKVRASLVKQGAHVA